MVSFDPTRRDPRVALLLLTVFCRFAGMPIDHASLLKQFEHLDPHNQNTFEAKDLELLISTVSPRSKR